MEELTTTKAMRAPSHCQTVWGLASNFPGRILSKHVSPGAVGAATTGVRDWQRPIVLLARDAEVRDVHSLIESQVDRLEAAAFAKRDALPAPTLAERQRASLSFEAIFRSQRPVNGRHLYYVEAAKTYPRLAPATDSRCPPVLLFQGWLAESASGNLTLLRSNVSVTDCDRKTTSDLSPFGIVTVDGRIHVLAGESMYEGEQHTIVEVGDAVVTRRFSAYVGGC
jgi:hypothetical protein